MTESGRFGVPGAVARARGARAPLPIRGIFAALSLAVVTASPVAATAGEVTASPPVARIEQAAARARALCHGKMHHDADEYVECIDRLRAHQPARGPERLGVEYFGWVGAVNSSRVGLPGAAVAAARYFAQFRASQRRVGIDDATLCKTVPGDCAARIALVRETAAARAVRESAARKPATGAAERLGSR